MWLIVLFTAENCVEVVPHKWFYKGLCAWPKFKKNKDFQTAIRSKMKSNKNDFNYFESRALSDNIGMLNIIMYFFSLLIILSFENEIYFYFRQL